MEMSDSDVHSPPPFAGSNPMQSFAFSPPQFGQAFDHDFDFNFPPGSPIPGWSLWSEGSHSLEFTGLSTNATETHTKTPVPPLKTFHGTEIATDVTVSFIRYLIHTKFDTYCSLLNVPSKVQSPWAQALGHRAPPEYRNENETCKRSAAQSSRESYFLASTPTHALDWLQPICPQSGSI